MPADLLECGHKVARRLEQPRARTDTPGGAAMADVTPENWRPIAGFEAYEVSDQGRVRRIVGGPGATAGRLIASVSHGRGYRRVTLWRHGTSQRFFVHQLVLEAFVGPCPDGYVCNHKDGDKENNRPANLEWVTEKENAAHAFRTGLRRPFHGEGHPRAKLTGAQVGQIRQLAGIESNADTAARYGVTKGQIAAIRRGASWRLVGTDEDSP